MADPAGQVGPFEPGFRLSRQKQPAAGAAAHASSGFQAFRHALSSYWSRRINDEHRMVYKVDGDCLLIAQLPEDQNGE